MPTLAAALFACMALLAGTAAAATNQHRIAVLEPDPELYRAISLGLAPWDVLTVKSDAPPPASSQPDAVASASRLARQLGVEALVWVSSGEGGALVWVFDARAGSVTARALSESPPFDSATAAAVALSVKTVLRTSAVAPAGERFEVIPTAPSPARSWAVELGAGGHWVSRQELDFRLDLAAVFWFAFERRLGLSFELSSGPGVHLEDERYRGRYREIVAGGRARLQLAREAGFSATASLGGALHVTSLEGTLVESMRERRVTRRNASFDAEFLLSASVGGGAYVGGSLGAAFLPAYRRYLVEGTPIFSPSPVVASFVGYCGVELF